MVKRCQWGKCNSDSRYPERNGETVEFIPFPKPKRSLDKCRRWVKACCRPHHQLNEKKIDGNYHLYVCTKHFREGRPTESYPDPLPAGSSDFSKCTPARRPPTQRAATEPPPKKRRKLFAEQHTSSNDNIENQTEDSLVETSAPSTKSSNQEETRNFSVADVRKEPCGLDMLALAAENKKLQQQFAKQVLENEELRRENALLRIKLRSKESNNNRRTEGLGTYSVESVPVRDFKYYTGFVFAQFMCIFQFLVPNKLECPMKFPKTITSIKQMKLEDQLLFTLMKLRLNLDFKLLGSLFGISKQDAGALFRTWINYMFFKFGSVPIWPNRDVITSKMPKKFKEDFPNTIITLDGTEIKIDRPSSLRSQTQCYSDYKSATTLKALVGVDPRGSFTFISMLFSGSISDKEITSRSGLLLLLEQLIDCGKIKRGDAVMVDKGFLIRDEIENLGLKLLIPPFASIACQMSAADVAFTRKIARHRVHVERAISRVKKFKIVGKGVGLSLFPCVNQVWYSCCFLTNFMPYLIKD